MFVHSKTHGYHRRDLYVADTKANVKSPQPLSLVYVAYSILEADKCSWVE